MEVSGPTLNKLFSVTMLEVGWVYAMNSLPLNSPVIGSLLSVKLKVTPDAVIVLAELDGIKISPV